MNLLGKLLNLKLQILPQTALWEAYKTATSEPYFFHIPPSLISFEDFCSMDIRWHALINEDDKVLGLASFGFLDFNNRSAGIGLIVLPEHRQGGIGKQALSLIESHGFNQMGLHRLWASVVEDNLHVWKGMKGLGWTVCGHFKECQFMNGKWHNRLILEKIGA